MPRKELARMRERMIRETEEFLTQKLGKRASARPTRRRSGREKGQSLIRSWQPLAEWRRQTGISAYGRRHTGVPPAPRP